MKENCDRRDWLRTLGGTGVTLGAVTMAGCAEEGGIGHSVTAYGDEIPDDAAYFASGGFDSEDAARDAYPDEGNIPGGESYSHTFETAGTYEYFSSLTR